MVRQGGFIIRLFFCKSKQGISAESRKKHRALFFLGRKMCEGISAEGPMKRGVGRVPKKTQGVIFSLNREMREGISAEGHLKMAATAQKPKPVFMT